jgi:anti-sigma factor (TIGR02949 family)
MTATLSCEEVIGKLLEYLDRELDAAAQQEVERHLEACRGCFSRAEFERRLRARVAETGDVKAPESLRERVRTLVARY